MLKKEIHGTVQCYQQTLCRCELCVEAKRLDNKKYYSKEKQRLRMRKFRSSRLRSPVSD
jgi:hypothetical protein